MISGKALTSGGYAHLCVKATGYGLKLIMLSAQAPLAPQSPSHALPAPRAPATCRHWTKKQGAQGARAWAL